MGKIYKKKQGSASSYIQILIIALVFGFFTIYKASNIMSLNITDQDRNEKYLSIPVSNNDVLTFEWIHSFEHIPWTEEYCILNNNELLLKKITIAGFGAGIPHNKGKSITTERGLIIMDEIDETFGEINWIHSQTAVDCIKLNNNVIIAGKDLPHHRSLNLRIEKGLKAWTK